MIEPGSPLAVRVGRWGLAGSLVIGAVLLGRIMRDMPYLLPNQLFGFVLYELGPGLILTLAVGFAANFTDGCAGVRTRLMLFVMIAAVTGVLTLS